MTILISAAIAYHALGLAVIPMRGKKPACRRWKPFQTASPPPATVRRWFGPRGPKGVTGIAVVLGAGSGDLCCRDFDTPAKYEQWSVRNPELAQVLPTARTRRGYHVYAVLPGQRLTGAEEGELRAIGGYVVLPPSAHPEGGTYAWIIPLLTLPPRVDAAVFFDGDRATESTETTESTECTDRKTEKTEEMCALAGSSPSLRTLPSRSSATATTTSAPTESARAQSEMLTPEVEAAVAATLPTEVGQRHKRVFSLARHLKGIPALREASFRELRPIVRLWHQRALKVIGTKLFDETWIDFTRAWTRVRWPKGASSMDKIISQALADSPPACAAHFEVEGVRMLVSICRALQRAAGDQPFFLSCRTAAPYLGVDHTTASRWLWLLQVEEIIAVVTVGGQKTTARKASRYRYIPSD